MPRKATKITGQFDLKTFEVRARARPDKVEDCAGNVGDYQEIIK